MSEILHSPDEPAISRTLELWRRILDALPSDYPLRATILGRLGIAFSIRFGRTGQLSDINAAIDAARAAVDSSPPGDPGRPVQLLALGVSLMARFERTGELADVDAAVATAQAVVDSNPDHAALRATAMTELGSALRIRFERTGELADVNAAIEAAQAAVDSTPADDSARPARVSALGVALLARHRRTGELRDLNASVEAGHAAVAATAAGDMSGRAARLSNLGIALGVRFERTGQRADADAAIEVGRAALEATPADHPDRALRLSNLSIALRSRFDRAGDLRDLDEAIADCQAAVDVTPPDDIKKAVYLSNLCSALQTRYARLGDQPDLDGAIAAGRASVEAAPADKGGLPLALSHLAGALRARFERTGRLADLDEAIHVLRAAVDATPVNHTNRPVYLSNLGNALDVRFERTGELADLDEGIQAVRAAVDLSPVGEPWRINYLTSLGNALRRRFERTGDTAALNEGIRVGQAAVNLALPGDPLRAGCLSNLAILLEARCASTGSATDLDTAIESLREAVDAAPADDPDRTMYQSNLGKALLSRFGRTEMPDDLDAAVDAFQGAVDTTPADHPRRAGLLYNLGIGLRARFEECGRPADRDAAVSVFAEAAGVDSAAPVVRVRTARVAAAMIAEADPGQAANLLEAAVRLLAEVAPRQLGRGEQQNALGEFAGLASDAAALVLAGTGNGSTRQQRAARALSLLEAGRAVLLSQALDTRDDLADLRRHDPRLAERFTDLRNRLNQPEDPATAGAAAGTGPAVTAPGWAVDERHRLAGELADTLAAIRAIDGFASFGLPPSTGELLAEAAQGPVVTFNVSHYRSDALLLTQDGISLVELPGFSQAALVDHIMAFQEAQLVAGDLYASRSARKAAQRSMNDILGWLWEAAARPTLHALGYDRPPPDASAWPRVWWATGGLLSLLPIHAAGLHAESATDSRTWHSVMDLVVSSYTPTIRALRYARQHASDAGSPGRSLIVGMPTTPGLTDGGRLLNVPAEIAQLRSLLPHPVVLTEPSGPHGTELSTTPTRANVFRHLPGSSIVHFACHGASHPGDPSRSLLVLHDYDSVPLTVASLAGIQHDQLQLVYLSACRTAYTGKAELIDEALHMASAFQLAGARHVIGTLWELNDALAVDIAVDFYRGLRTEPGIMDTGQAPYALHSAVRAARDTYFDVPSLWAGYLHSGA